MCINANKKERCRRSARQAWSKGADGEIDSRAAFGRRQEGRSGPLGEGEEENEVSRKFNPSKPIRVIIERAEMTPVQQTEFVRWLIGKAEEWKRNSDTEAAAKSAGGRSAKAKAKKASGGR